MIERHRLHSTVRKRKRGPRAPVSALSAPESASGRLQRDCLALLKQHERDGAIPTNGRFVFYELEQLGKITKSYTGRTSAHPRIPAQDVSAALMVLRQLGLIPWEWLTDETREVTEWRYADSVYQYVLDRLDHARIDCWGGEPPPLILCEARATKGVLESTTAEYLCPITATNGQCGGFLVTDVVPLLKGNNRKVLYIGDYEERGPADQIEANTRRYIEKHSGRVFTAETWIKIALTREQVNRNPRLRNLTIRKLDHRYKPAQPYDAIECEAVGQKTLERMLRARLDALLPEPLDDVLVRQERQKGTMRRMLAQMRRR
jgi:hypothetical protein